jgi:hypothetical protein
MSETGGTNVFWMASFLKNANARESNRDDESGGVGGRDDTLRDDRKKGDGDDEVLSFEVKVVDEREGRTVRLRWRRWDVRWMVVDSIVACGC